MDHSLQSGEPGAPDECSVPEIPGLPSYQELHQAVAEIESLIEPYDPLASAITQNRPLIIT